MSSRRSFDLDPLPRAARGSLACTMLAAHLAAGWWLVRSEPVRNAVGEMAPIMVDLLAPPHPKPPAAPLPKVQPKPAAPKPVVAGKPTAAPAPFVAPPPALQEPQPERAERAEPVVAPEPAVAAAPPAPPAPPAPQPRTIAVSAVEYLEPPVLAYPPASRRMHEEGRVHVRVLVDANGLPRQTTVIRSSGYPRLDESALATVRATRFKPYTENGVPLPFWVVMPLIFEMEN